MEAILWIVAAIIVGMIARSKRYDLFPWFLYGLVLPPIAFVHILLKKRDTTPKTREEFDAAERERQREERNRSRQPCPHCSELILPSARVCPHCQRDLAKNWAEAGS